MSSQDHESTAAKRRRQRGALPSGQKMCSGCDNIMSQADQHDLCAYCLGWRHVRDAIDAPGDCRYCAAMDIYTKNRRISRVEKSMMDPDEWEEGGRSRGRQHPPNRPPNDPWPGHAFTDGYRRGDVYARLGARPRGAPTSTVTTRAPLTNAPDVGGSYGASRSVARPQGPPPFIPDDEQDYPTWPRSSWAEEMSDEEPLGEVYPSVLEYTDGSSAMNEYFDNYVSAQCGDEFDGQDDEFPVLEPADEAAGEPAEDEGEEAGEASEEPAPPVALSARHAELLEL